MDIYRGPHRAQLVAFCAKACCGRCRRGVAGLAGVFLLSSIISLDRTKHSLSIHFSSTGWQLGPGHSQTLPPGYDGTFGMQSGRQEREGAWPESAVLSLTSQLCVSLYWPWDLKTCLKKKNSLVAPSTIFHKSIIWRKEMPDLRLQKTKSTPIPGILGYTQSVALFISIFNLEPMSATAQLQHCTKETSHRQFCPQFSKGLEHAP